MSYVSIPRARRLFAASMLSLGVAGCSVTGEGLRTVELSGPHPWHDVLCRAAAEKFPVEAVDTSRIDAQFLKQMVDYRAPYPPGTVVVDPHRRFLYLVQKGDKAIRYGVGVGARAWPLRARARCRKNGSGRTGHRRRP